MTLCTESVSQYRVAKVGIWSFQGGTGSVYGDTGWYLLVPSQYNAVPVVL